MNKHWFEYMIKDGFVRQMNRKEYKAAMSWLRSCRNKVEKRIDTNQLQEAATSLMLYGTASMLRRYN